MPSPPPRSRRDALRAGGAAVAAAFAGCLSGSPGSGDDAGTGTTVAAATATTGPATGRTTRATTEGSGEAGGSPAHGTTIGMATHPIDLVVRNGDDAAREVTVRVRLDGAVTRSERFRLAAGGSRTVAGALAYPESGERRYVVTLALGDGTESSRAWTVHAVHVLHRVTAAITADGGVGWGSVVH